MRYHYTSIWMAEIWDPKNTKMVTGTWSNSNELSFIAGGNTNGTATLESSLTVSYKTKRFIIQFRNNAPWHFPKRVKNLYPYKSLYMDICSSSGIIAKIWKPPRRPSVGEWVNNGPIMDQNGPLLWSIQAVEYYSAPERNEISSHEKTWSNLTRQKKSIWKGDALYNSNYMPFWKKQIYRDEEKIISSQGFRGRKRWTGGSQRIFRAVKILCVTLWWWQPVRIHLFKPI